LCRCTGPIAYQEPGEAPHCAKCGRRVSLSDIPDCAASSRREERIGSSAPDPRPEPAALSAKRQPVPPGEADPPPAPQVARPAGSGPDVDWPFNGRAGSRPEESL
jgi:hypothetical protein